MIERLKPYPRMKDSGIAWLGQVPEHWAVRRLRHVVDLRVSNVDKHTSADEQPVRLCNYVDVYKNERIRDVMAFMNATATPDEIARFQLRPGDVLITKDSESWDDIGVPALVEQTAKDLVCGYHLAILRPDVHQLRGDYLLRALQSRGVAYQFHIEANGVTRYGLSHAAIKSITIPIPPSHEQAAIARFLDWADSRIRRYIHAKQKLIKLLEELKKAIIQRAVTRGLNPSVRLRHSGIEFLEGVPEHWEVMLNQRILKEEVRPHNADPETQLSLSQKDGLIATSAMKERSLQTSTYDNWKVVLPGDLVLNRFKAHLGVFFAATLRGIVSFHYGVFAPRRPLVTKYFELLYHTNVYRAIYAARSNGMTVGLQNLSNQNFYSVRSTVPPYDEQAAITLFSEKAAKRLNEAVHATQREIKFLREYYTRLTAELVTGRLDVREFAANLPADLSDAQVVDFSERTDDEPMDAEIRVEDDSE
jgi:type I restriction enzyme, S subunit